MPGVPIDSRDRQRLTPLHLAARFGYEAKPMRSGDLWGCSRAQVASLLQYPMVLNAC